jgi:uncharacterized BrkB/YihY/UPF0761 family membrane protein
VDLVVVLLIDTGKMGDDIKVKDADMISKGAVIAFSVFYIIISAFGFYLVNLATQQ